MSIKAPYAENWLLIIIILMNQATLHADEKTIYVPVGDHVNNTVGVGYGFLPGDGHELTLYIQAPTNSSSTVGWLIKNSNLESVGSGLWDLDSPVNHSIPATNHVYSTTGVGEGGSGLTYDQLWHAIKVTGDMIISSEAGGDTVPTYEVDVAQVNIHSEEVAASNETTEDVSGNAEVGLIVGVKQLFFCK